MEERLEELTRKIEQSDLSNEDVLNELYGEISAELGNVDSNIDDEINMGATKSQTVITRAQNKFKKQYFLISEEYIYHDEKTDRNKRGKRLTNESAQRMIELYIEFMRTGDYEKAKTCELVITAETPKSQEFQKMLKSRNKDIARLKRKMEAYDKAQRIEAKKEKVLQEFQEYREYVENIKSEIQQEEEFDVGIQILELFDSIGNIESEKVVVEENSYEYEDVQEDLVDQENEQIQGETSIQDDTVIEKIREEIFDTSIEDVEGVVQSNVDKVAEDTIILNKEDISKAISEQRATNKQDTNIEQNSEVALAPIVKNKKEGAVKTLLKIVKNFFSRKEKTEEKFGEV